MWTLTIDEAYIALEGQMRPTPYTWFNNATGEIPSEIPIDLNYEMHRAYVRCRWRRAIRRAIENGSLPETVNPYTMPGNMPPDG